VGHKLSSRSEEPLDLELVVFSNIMHDLGWSQDHTFISKDKRFEVDSADLARSYLRKHVDSEHWDKHRTQLMWDTIALHATGSFARHKEPEVVIAHYGVMADFFGPALPGGLLTVEEYQAVVKAFPRIGFRSQFLQIMCGLCNFKPETTYDNFVSDYGVVYGTDAKGKDKEVFAQSKAAHASTETLWMLLKACQVYEDGEDQ
jgi:hypothetical protein